MTSIGIDDAITRLQQDAYLAALDDGRWADWAWRATELLGGRCGSLYVLGQDGDLKHQTILHPDIRAIERYVAEEMYRYDPQVAHVTSLCRSQVYRDVDHIDPDNPETAEYLSWQTSNAKLRHYATATARLSGGAYAAGLSVHRDVADGPTPPDVVRIMDRLLPDLGRSMALGFAHAGKLNASYWDGLLEHRQEPSALLDDDGRVIRMTGALEAMVATGDGLSCRQGRLTGCQSTADARLQAAVARATALSLPRAGACRIERPSGRTAYVATVYPLPRRAEFFTALGEAAALVTIVDPAWSPPAPNACWAEAFGLTAREAELATLLMERHSIDTAAATLSISTATARVHLANLFAKTQTSRQPELIRLLSRLS